MRNKNTNRSLGRYLSALIPIILTLLGGFFFMVLERTGGASGPICAFKKLLWWISGLLALLFAGSLAGELITFLEAKRARKKSEDDKAETKPKKDSRISRLFGKIPLFFSRFAVKKSEADVKSDEENAPESVKSESSDDIEDIPSELKNIKREEAEPSGRRKEKTVFDRIRVCLFVLIFAATGVGLYFFFTTMFKEVADLSGDKYSYGLLTTLYFLFYAVIMSVYIKLRRVPEKKAIYRISGDIAKIISALSIVYAGVIAVESVLAVNAIVVLPWVIRCVAVYLTIALAIDLIIAIMKGDLLDDLDYPLIPTGGGGADGVLESDSVRERFSLKSLWSIKYALRLLPGIALAIGAALLVSTMFYVVQPGEQAALYRFGKLDESRIADPGFHLKLPWPIDKVDYYNVDRVATVRIGYDNPTGTDYLWTMSHGGEEYPLLTGNGNEVVVVNIKLAYRINDLYSYVSTSSAPESVLSAVAYESIMRRTINTTLDAFLSVDRASLSYDLKEELERFTKDSKLGVEVVDVIIENIHPPVDVADVYQAVITASVDKAALITSASTEALQLVNYAKYYKEQLINDAQKKQADAVGAATGELAYYFAMMEAYKVNPECFTLTQYINVQSKRIAGAKVYYFSPKTEQYINDFILGGTAGSLVASGK